MLSLLLAVERWLMIKSVAFTICSLWLGVNIVGSMIFWLKPRNFYGRIE